jgi:hypothetical protein
VKPSHSYLIVVVGLLFASWGMQYNALSNQHDSIVETCERANPLRLAVWRSATQDATDASTIAGQTNDPELEAIWKARSELKAQIAADQVEGAARSGAQSAPGSPTLICSEVVDPVSLNPLG